MQAPGAVPAAAGAMRLPGREDFPRVDDHIVVPELSRDEMIGGRRYETMGAQEPHATKHSQLDYVLRAKVATGYTTASDLQTRVDEDSDFAADGTVLREGIDPDTGTRYLEELAFEIVSEQSKSKVTDKAVRMLRRGVRRLFALFVKTGKVCEWSPTTQTWEALAAGSRIDDPCLVEPLAVEALLDAAAADDAVASALITKSNPVIEEFGAERRAEGKTEGKAEGKAEGKTEGRAEDVLSILTARGLEPSDTVEERVLSCTDPDLLHRWLVRAVTASSADEVFDEP